MLKKIFFLISFVMTFGVFAQDTERIEDNEELKYCGQFEALEKMRLKHPDHYQLYLQSRAEAEQETERSVERAGTIYTIPVVFHVLHNNGSENITDAQIHDALSILNRDFRKLNADVNSVYHTFLPIASDAEIEFELATIAPNGDCFNGITRTVSYLTSLGEDGYDQIEAIVDGNNVYQGIWPHHKYLNINICEDLGNAAGYTYLPNGYATVDLLGMMYNSIFMRSDYVGSIGSSQESRSRALTHEVGHWLNLNHIWGSGPIGVNCGDDNVADTPPTKGFSSPCPTSNSAKICNPPVVENFENYMDYSYCSKMFTQGQSSRMRTAIIGSLGGRSNIWTTTNLQNVGVLGSTNTLCNAEIEATQTGVCAGNSTTYSVSNISVPITSYSWSFPGGSPASSTLANPTVTYSTVGSYNATVTITTASTSKTLANLSYINVGASSTIYPLPISEGFVSSTFPPLGWTINNGGKPTTWKRNLNGIAPTPGNSANLNFDPNQNTTGDIDDLNTPTFSLVGYTSASVTFDVAYKPYSTTYSDTLEVLISPECGMPYEVIYSKGGSTLQTETPGSGYTNPNTWRREAIDLTPYLGSSHLSVKFRGVSGYGNQIYIDNINISDFSVPLFTTSSNSVCNGKTVTYASTTPGATSWSWNFGTGASPATASGAGPFTVSYAGPGTKVVTLSHDGGVTTTTKTIVVNPVPNVNLNSFPTLCVNNNPIALSQGFPSGGTYSGVGVSGNQFNPATAGTGTHTITYSYTSPATNCTSSKTKQITVEGCLGFDEEDAQKFKIFPNPTKGAITISSSVIIDEVLVLDNAGRVVETLIPEKSKSVNLDLQHLSSGIYMIQTKIGSQTKMNKIVVE